MSEENMASFRAHIASARQYFAPAQGALEKLTSERGELSVGIANFLEQMKIMHAPTPTAKAQEIARRNQLENRSPREGSPID